MRFVGSDDHALGGNHAVHKLEVDAWSLLVKETTTLAEDERMDKQHISVDQVCGQQGPYELRAANDAEIRPGLSLQLADTGCWISGKQDRVLPR